MSKKEGGGKQGGEKDVSAMYKELQTHKLNEEYEKAIKVTTHTNSSNIGRPVAITSLRVKYTGTLAWKYFSFVNGVAIFSLI